MQRRSVAELCRAVAAFSFAVLLWMLAPVSLLVPKDRRRVIVIGRDEGKFVDNAKYALLAAPSDLDVIFLSERGTTVACLHDMGLQALRWPNFGAVWSCLRASAVVVDSAEWTRNGRLQCLWRAPVYQLWHGIPLKEIELELFRRRIERMSLVRGWMLRLYKHVLGRYWSFEGVAVTSVAAGTRLFENAFRAQTFVPSGYPRNDVLLKKATEHDLINVDQKVLLRCRRWRDGGGKVCLYAPTFRKHRKSAFDENVLSAHKMNEYGERQGILFVLKMHPLIDNATGTVFDNVVTCDPGSDVYPLLPEVDLLCTDYSSLFFDFLLLDRPQVFFAYDLDEYLRTDRAMNMNYVSTVPGRVCHDWKHLQTSIEASLRSDEYAERRARLRAEMFDHVDANAGVRIWTVIRERLRVLNE